MLRRAFETKGVWGEAWTRCGCNGSLALGKLAEKRGTRNEAQPQKTPKTKNETAKMGSVQRNLLLDGGEQSRGSGSGRESGVYVSAAMR